MRFSWLYFIVFMLLLGTVFSFKTAEEKSHSSMIGQNELPLFLRRTTAWSAEQLSKMSLEEKIAQSIMVATYPSKGVKHLQEIDSLINNYKIGGLIVFKGSLEEAKASISHFQSKSKLPLLIGMDAEWGSAMRMTDAERFPFAITMGAANLPKQTEVIAQQMAFELNNLGVHINFAPVADINSNPNNPVIGFRAFGESPLLVGQQSSAMIKGLERNGVLSCMKHFPGHGDVAVDSHFDLPILEKSFRDLDIEDWTPFKMGRLAGASSLMMAHLNVPDLDSTGTPSSLSKKVIQDIVRKHLKFTGLIFSDALNMKAVADRYGKTEVAVLAYEAGNDILLYPEEIENVIAAIVEKVKNGVITEEEINEKCLRILKAKDYIINQSQASKAVDVHQLEFAKWEIYEKAITVVKNESLIPIKSRDVKTLFLQLGQVKPEFESRMNDYLDAKFVSSDNVEGLLEKVNSLSEKFDQIVFSVFASSMLPKNNFNYPEKWEQVISSLPEALPKALVLYGNPYVWKDDVLSKKFDAILFAMENTAWSADRVAQLLAGAYVSSGKLPVSLSPEYLVGTGIETPKASRLKYTVPEELGISRKKLAEIDELAGKGISQGAYPGCQIVAAKDGKVFYQKSFGFQTYENTNAVNNETVYDLASITKIASSTISLMKLQDDEKFSLNASLSDYLPNLVSGTPYANVNLKKMMAHQAGFTAWIPFYNKTLIEGKPNPDLYAKVPNDSMRLWVAENLFMKDNYEEELYAKILSTPITPGAKYKYSDVGYYFVKRIVQSKSGQAIDEFALNNFYLPMGLRSMRYNPLHHYDKSRIAPTEDDTYFRNQLIHGYVHDQGAAMTNGVGGHAGLFSTATDLAALMQMLLNKGVYGGDRYLSEEVIAEYTKCQFCPSNRRGAGFDKPVRNLQGGPTCNLVSLSSFGHSGFTGTLTWADPEFGINYVFLSNRVHPSAENWKLIKMGIRTEIQRVIYEAVLGK